jgi:hypothetical protein
VKRKRVAKRQRDLKRRRQNKARRKKVERIELAVFSAILFPVVLFLSIVSFPYAKSLDYAPFPRIAGLLPVQMSAGEYLPVREISPKASRGDIAQSFAKMVRPYALGEGQLDFQLGKGTELTLRFSEDAKPASLHISDYAKRGDKPRWKIRVSRRSYNLFRDDENAVTFRIPTKISHWRMIDEDTGESYEFYGRAFRVDC